MKKFGIIIDVDTSAFDKFVKDFEKGLQPEGFDEWANRVSRTAKELCNDPDCKRIRLRPDATKKALEVDCEDREAVDCVLQSIARHQKSMPLSLQAIYEGLKSELEARKQNL